MSLKLPTLNINNSIMKLHNVMKLLKWKTPHSYVVYNLVLSLLLYNAYIYSLLNAISHSGRISCSGKQSTAVRDHMLDFDHVIKSDDLILVTRVNSDYLLQIKESMFLGRDDPSLNMTIKSVTLYLF